MLPGLTRASDEVINAVLDSLSLRFDWIEEPDDAQDPRLEAKPMFSAPYVSLGHDVVVVQNGYDFEGNMAANVPAGSSHGYGTWIDVQSNGDAEQGPVTGSVCSLIPLWSFNSSFARACLHSRAKASRYSESRLGRTSLGGKMRSKLCLEMDGEAVRLGRSR